MIQLSDASVIVNNEPVPVIPDSVKFREGLGTQKMRTASIGGGEVEAVYANSLEDKLGNVMFDMPSTPETIALARKWKLLKNQNVVQIIGATVDGNVTRTFAQAAILNDYEVGIGSDSNIGIEFKSRQAV